MIATPFPIAIRGSPPVAIGSQHDLPDTAAEDERLAVAVNPVKPPLPEQIDGLRHELRLLVGDGVALALAQHGLDDGVVRRAPPARRRRATRW